MRSPQSGLLSALMLATTLIGCSTIEPKPGPTLARLTQLPTQQLTPPPSPLPETDSGVAASSASQPGLESTGAKVLPEAGSGAPRVQFNLHVFGLSYHPDRAGIRASHLDNEFNAGLGLNYELGSDARGATSVEAGVFKDSGRNWAKFAGVGYQFKFGERWRLGADLLAIQSETYNHGRSFVAPVPHLTYDFGPVKLNAIYVPRLAPYNHFAVFGIYLTLPLKQW